jgi:hypothetical protein
MRREEVAVLGCIPVILPAMAKKVVPLVAPELLAKLWASTIAFGPGTNTNCVTTSPMRTSLSLPHTWCAIYEYMVVDVIYVR